MEVLRYIYRKTFGLSARELAEEPTDEFFTNIHIIAKISERQADEAKYGNQQ